MVILREGLCPGLTSEIINTLKNNNIRTVVDLVSSDLEEVARKCCLSYKAMVAMRRVLLAQFSAFPSNGADLYEELKSSTAILSTGSSSLDKMLDSGLYTGEVTELTGAAGSGKTQVCLGVAITAAHSLKQSVLYVDSTGGLTASRLLELARTQTEDEEEQAEAMQRIEVVRVFDIYKMMDVLQDLRWSLSQQVASSLGPVKVVIVDSVCAVVYPLLGGKQADGMALMMQLARELKTLARELSIAVLVTNHVTREGSGDFRPALGRSWGFVPSTRILLEQKKGIHGESTNQRIATLTKSPRHFGCPWGSVFHSLGPWTENLRSPLDLQHLLGMWSRLWLAERRKRPGVVVLYFVTEPTRLQALLEIGSCAALERSAAPLGEVS